MMSFASNRGRTGDVSPRSPSPAMVLVEKATSDRLSEPDWAINIDICDTLNSDLRQAREVIKAVKKRLANKSPMVQFLALTLLETMIKNCGDHVHLQVVECEVLDEMVKIVKKKTDMLARDKILLLLDSWQEAFGGPQGKYPQYFWAYVEVKGSGVEFPQRSGDIAPIFTPPVSKPAQQHPHRSHKKSTSSVRLDEAIAFEKGNMSLSELDSMRRAMELLKDMLEAVNPNDCEALQDDVIIELVKQCCSNQKRIMHVINSTRNEELLFQGLALNDDLQNLIVKYNALATGQPLPSKEPDSLSGRNPMSTGILNATAQLDEEEDENDGFTQIARRNSNTTQRAFDNIQSSELGSRETSGKFSATDGKATSISLPKPIPAITVQKGQDVATLLSTLSFGQSPQSLMHIPPNSSPFISPISHASTPSSATFISPISHASTPSSANSYGTPMMISSMMPPVNPLPASPNSHAIPSEYLIPALYSYIPQNDFPNQGYLSYNGDIVPWGQQSLPPSMYELQAVRPESLSGYPPPPWEMSPSREDDNFLSTSQRIGYGSTSSEALQVQGSNDHGDASSQGMPAAQNVPSTAPSPLLEDQVEIRNAEEVKSNGSASTTQDQPDQRVDEGIHPSGKMLD